MKSKELTWKRAIQRVLSESASPLHYTEITERIIADGLRQNFGATPKATVSAQITTSIKRKGEESPFVRIDRGTYALRSKESNVVPSDAQEESTSDVADYDYEAQYAIVTSFGMFWQREAIDWARNPKLLGIQQIGATPVDFNQQRGIYLLYDGREVIYAGRTTERALGTRLYEHTVDRLSARWDRFSWFGLVPVLDSGDLGSMPETFDAAKLIPALEAILVEALEPRQNRKRGDDLGDVEYMQKEDPKLRKRRLRAEMDDLINRA